MFRIRVTTPAIVDERGRPCAAALLVAGNVRHSFFIDLEHWRIAEYERQWKDGIQRLVGGARVSALMSRHSGNSGRPHRILAMWRSGKGTYIQPLCLLPAELESRFDPRAPYRHVGPRVPVTEARLPLEEWHVAHTDVVEAAFQIRWPFAQ